MSQVVLCEKQDTSFGGMVHSVLNINKPSAASYRPLHAILDTHQKNFS